MIKTKVDGKIVELRVHRFYLDLGVEEILVTNLMDEYLGKEDFKALHFKSWGIKTKYNEFLKHKYQVNKG